MIASIIARNVKENCHISDYNYKRVAAIGGRVASDRLYMYAYRR